MPSEPQLNSALSTTPGWNSFLGQKIAKGAQGTVFRVEGHPGYAIKLLNRPEDLERIAAVRRLPLEGLSVAAPLTLIRTGGTGYLMRLASDMKPIREPYLPREFGARETNADWYRQTGGLRRRLAIAANMARSIAALHERGLAYVDLNPNNVMVSDDLNRAETWLIDTDNLTSRSPRSGTSWVSPVTSRRKELGGRCPALDAGRYLHPRGPRVPSAGAAVPLGGVAADSLDGNEARERRWTVAISPMSDDPQDRSNQLPPRSFPAGLFPLVMSGRMRSLCRADFRRRQA